MYENDLAFVKVGQYADIRLNAYPNTVYKGRLSNIGTILDPNIRTAKVRIELQNPGLMRLGMFVEATFHGLESQVHAVLPASAILHLHDRDWVYVPQGGNTFRRVEVRSGKMIAPGQQEILSGMRPGERAVTDALDLQNTAGYYTNDFFAPGRNESRLANRPPCAVSSDGTNSYLCREYSVCKRPAFMTLLAFCAAGSSLSQKTLT